MPLNSDDDTKNYGRRLDKGRETSRSDQAWTVTAYRGHDDQSISKSPGWMRYMDVSPTSNQSLERSFPVCPHPPEDRIEVFQVQKRPVSLRHIRTITDPNFTFMNDLIAVGRDQFYITRYNWYRSGDWIKFAHWLHIKEGTIFFYDGHRARQAVSETYYLSDGISVSPDKRTVYMSEWGKKTLHAYRRKSNNKLTPLWKEYLDTGIDNINVDQETGDLWIGSHSVTWRLVDFYGIFGKQTAPSQVLRVKVSDGGVDAVEEIYSDNGEECAGSTSAVYAEGKLMIGSLFEQTITCDIAYLSK
ncbi:serum paraoxonase/arylesterase 1-like [Mya arenaria]|uniref:serum paraoxonase/arylesterase 1-like n=1 Tax=Mya arenaria TaxID=6604 RepID=UPI0022E7734D|nr:serum paraoxonase/arylesterase 1-like [Mya arenaria]